MNLKRRQLNTFQRVELALKKKPILENIARENMSLGGIWKGVKNVTPLGRVDQKIAEDAGTSRGTVTKVETILEKSDIEDIDKTRAGKQKINETWNHVKRNEIQKQLFEAASEQEISSVFQMHPELITRETERQTELIPKIDKTIFEQNICTKKDIISFLLPLEDTAVLTNVYFEVDNSQMKQVGLKIE